jgi:hypothetical protein
VSGARARRAAAAVALTAAAVLTAACGGGGGGEDRRPSSSPAPTHGPRTGEDGADGGKAEKQRPDGETAGGGPSARGTVPRAKLTPGTGTLSEKQKDYLVNRVPHGMEPAAVLEAGQAACRRIGYVAGADRGAALSALRSDEIANAEAAVKHLCPRWAKLLDEAREGQE